jgi:ribosome biogenesis GTPase A
LPNAGKSTLLNALAARRLSPTASHPHSELSIHLYLS